MVSMRIRGRRPRPRRRSAGSPRCRPSRASGRPSARRRAAASRHTPTASVAVGGGADDGEVGLRRPAARAKPARTTSWSSTTTTPDHVIRGPPAGSGSDGLDEEAAAGRRARSSAAADHGRPLAHAEQPVPVRGRGSAPRPGPVVADPQVQSVLAVVRAPRRPPRPARAGGRWSAPPARSGRRSARRPAVERRHVAAHDQPGRRRRPRARLVEQLVELRSPGCGCGARGSAVSRPRAARPAGAASRSARPGRVADRGQPSRALGRHAGVVSGRPPPARRSSRCGARRRRAVRGRSGRARPAPRGRAACRASPAARLSRAAVACPRCWHESHRAPAPRRPASRTRTRARRRRRRGARRRHRNGSASSTDQRRARIVAGERGRAR